MKEKKEQQSAASVSCFCDGKLQVEVKPLDNFSWIFLCCSTLLKILFKTLSERGR